MIGRDYDYDEYILSSLLKNNIIDVDLYEKCSKPHIHSLPNNYKTNDSEKYQERYDELNKRIDEIRDEWGWISKVYDEHVETDDVRNNRMNFYEKRFKKLDKKIYNECKDYINELKQLMEEANSVWDKSETDYGVVKNYGEYGELNPYEQFLLFCDQFKSKNAGKGNQINGDGFYSYSPDNFSFERGNSYLNYVLSNIMKESSFVIRGKSIFGDISNEDMASMPKKDISNILKKLSNLQVDYDYECQKIRDDYKMKTMKKMNELRDYYYEKDRLEIYCEDNGIPIETRK